MMGSTSMNALKAHVENGRIVVDDPTDLSDGTELYVAPVNDADDLDDEERAELHAALDEAEEDIVAGRVVTEDEVWATLRAIK
jgi:uridine phosphorylase